MELRIFTEPQQGATYDDLLRIATATEQLGFDAFFRSDHYLLIGDGEAGPDAGRPGSTDAWLTLAALARETSRIRLGTLVSPATFRLPGVLAISAAQADQMSGGRIEIGLGAGWYEREHSAYGIPFPDVATRFDRFVEQVEIVHGLLSTPDGARFDYPGTHYQVVDSPALPKPVQSPPPLILGGNGRRRGAALAARYAAEYNVPFHSAAQTGVILDRVRAAAGAAGRELVSSAAQVICVGRTDAEVSRRAAAIGEDVDALRARGLAGSPEHVIERIAEFAAQGVTRLYLQTLDIGDLDHLQLVADAIAPHV